MFWFWIHVARVHCKKGLLDVIESRLYGRHKILINRDALFLTAGSSGAEDTVPFHVSGTNFQAKWYTLAFPFVILGAGFDAFSVVDFDSEFLAQHGVHLVGELKNDGFLFIIAPNRCDHDLNGGDLWWTYSRCRLSGS